MEEIDKAIAYWQIQKDVDERLLKDYVSRQIKLIHVVEVRGRIECYKTFINQLNQIKKNINE